MIVNNRLLLGSLTRLLLFCMIALVVLPGFASSLSDAKARTTKTINLVTGTNYFPFISDRAPDGGWSQALVKAVFKHMGETIHIDVLPWARGYQWASEGRYAGTFPYVHSLEREAHFLYSQPINWVPVKMYVAANSDYTQLHQLSQKSLCLPYGYTLDSRSIQLLEQFEFRISRAKDAKACAGQVMKRWSDVGMINGYFTSKQLVERFGSLDNIRLLDEDIGSIPLYFIVPKAMPNAEAFVERFNTSLLALIQSGEKQRIHQRYVDWLGQKDITMNGHQSTSPEQPLSHKKHKPTK